MKKLRIFVQVLIGAAIVAFILNRLKISEVLSALRQVDYIYFVLACLAYLCLNIVLASRLRYLLRKIGYSIGFTAVFFSHMGGMMVGDITPGKSGYFLTPPILKKISGTRITDGMACIFAPQGVEFITKVIGAMAAIIYISALPGISSEVIISAALGAFALLIVGILMLAVSWRDEKLSSNFLGRLPFFKNFASNLTYFKEKNIDIKENIGAILMFTILGWLFAALHWYYLGRALGFELSYSVFFLLHPLLSILMFVPVSPAGFGLLEGGAILVFSLLGVQPEPALAFIVLVRGSALLVDLLGLKNVLSSLSDLEL